jgi:hypothetical protein
MALGMVVLAIAVVDAEIEPHGSVSGNKKVAVAKNFRAVKLSRD